MNRLMSWGIYSLLLAFIAGVWMIVSPFAMDAQAVGASWSRETVNNVVVGGVLIAIALVSVGVILALQLREAARASNQRSQQALNQPAA